MERNKVVYLHCSGLETRDVVLSKAFREHKPALTRFLLMRLANEQDREDIIQDVFVRLCQQADLSEKLSFGTTRAYLFAIASNLIRDMKRRETSRAQERHGEFNENVHVLNQATTEDHVLHKQELVLIKKAIRNLDRRCQEAFVLSRFWHMSYRDISKRMGVSNSMVEKYISHALMQLRQAVGRA